MIVVKVELHSAITGQVTEIGRMMINNVGGSASSGDYQARTYRGRSAETLARAMKRNEVTRKGKIEGHARLRLHVWHLIAKALASMGYGQ
ncbi:hypothetical protein [Alteraurantiacibacter palmitatis]|uniref:Uncharacterized protein n=1 Tax=Alteraurantiacibacter palmitatis TaxID=2054628 RepID=A0ABV7E616_9SPHN